MTVLKKIVLCLFGFFISLFLFACTNFLNGNELSKALEKEIESNTKNPITIRLSIENPNIQYLTNYGDFSIKLYEEKTIEFKIDSSLYEFENWKVLSKNNSSTDCSNNVSLQTENSGNTFKTKLIVNSVDSDLILIPITKTLPNVNIIEPKNSVSGVICFRPIKITFSTPMNESDLNTFENITITDRYGVMLSDDDDDYSYFNKPELSEDGLTLTIKPKAKISEIVTASRTNRI